MTLFAQRLKQARQRAGLTQEGLGIKAGFDEMSASARMNQYERGKHMPDVGTAARLARTLDIPVEFLYCEGDDFAELVLLFHTLPARKRESVLMGLRTSAASSTADVLAETLSKSKRRKR